MDQLQFGPGDAAPLPRLDVTQACPSDSIGIEPLEIRGRDFPLSRKEIEDAIKDEDLYCVVVKLNFRCQAWAAFKVKGNDIIIERISFMTRQYAPLVMQALMEAVTFSPAGTEHPTVTITWPEHEIDRWFFQFLREEGWEPSGTSPGLYSGYGTKWDGYILARKF